MIALRIVAAALALGCSGIPGFDVTAVHSNSAELATALRGSIARIDRATGIHIDYSNRFESVPFRFGQTKKGTHGHWNGFSRRATISRLVSPIALETVVLHELLHALGAHHIGFGRGVMSPVVAGPTALSVDDLVELCGAGDNACGWMQAEEAPEPDDSDATGVIIDDESAPAESGPGF